MSSSLNWDDIFEATNSTPASSPSSNDSSSKQANNQSSSSSWRTSDLDVTDFGPSTLDDDIQLLKCFNCGKVVLKEAGDFHKKNCKLTQDIVDGKVSPSVMGDDNRVEVRNHSEPLGAETSAVTAMLKEGKLTKKAEADLRRMQKAEARERKGLKGKKAQPHDVDRQCGVINEKGLPCTRSLTCKTHSMGAKRAVPGRSRDYDILLFEWQKATNPGFLARVEEKEREQAAAAEAAAIEAERKKNEPEPAPKGKKRKRRQTGGEDGTLDGVLINSKRADEGEMDMWELGADDDDVDRELGDLISSISGQSHIKSNPALIPPTSSHSTFNIYNPILFSRSTTHLAAYQAIAASLPQPLATRSFAGTYTSRSRVLRGKGEASRGVKVNPGTAAHSWILLKEGLKVGRESQEQMTARFSKQQNNLNLKQGQQVNGNQLNGQPRQLPILTPQQFNSLPPHQQAEYLKVQQFQQNQLRLQAQVRAQNQNKNGNQMTTADPQIFAQQAQAQARAQAQAIAMQQQQQQQQQQHNQIPMPQPQQQIQPNQPNAQAALISQQMRKALAGLTEEQRLSMSKMTPQQQRDLMSRLLQGSFRLNSQNQQNGAPVAQAQ